MINLKLDRKEFFSVIEGLVRSSQSAQYVWREIVYKSIFNMNAEDLDYLWYYLRRDIHPCYFYDHDGATEPQPGHDDFAHALAAMHRGNRYTVTCQGPKQAKRHKYLCYRYNGEYRPLLNVGVTCKRFQPFDAVIPKEWIKAVEHRSVPENIYVPDDKKAWWTELPE